MSTTTPQAVARASLPPHLEIVDGRLRRRPWNPALQRSAARIARLLEAPARTVGAWVSAEALVRVDHQRMTDLRPAVVVAAGDLPYDGVIRTPPLLVVELDPLRGHEWRGTAAGALWIADDSGVTVRTPTGTTLRVTPPDSVRVPGLPALTLPAAPLVEGAVVHTR